MAPVTNLLWVRSAGRMDGYIVYNKCVIASTFYQILSSWMAAKTTGRMELEAREDGRTDGMSKKRLQTEARSVGLR